MTCYTFLSAELLVHATWWPCSSPRDMHAGFGKTKKSEEIRTYQGLAYTPKPPNKRRLPNRPKNRPSTPQKDSFLFICWFAGIWTAGAVHRGCGLHHGGDAFVEETRQSREPQIFTFEERGWWRSTEDEAELKNLRGLQALNTFQLSIAPMLYLACHPGQTLVNPWSNPAKSLTFLGLGFFSQCSPPIAANCFWDSSERAADYHSESYQGLRDMSTCRNEGSLKDLKAKPFWWNATWSKTAVPKALYVWLA